MRPATVYVIEGPHAVKIGVTRGTTDARLADIERATGLPLFLLADYPAVCWAHALQVEKDSHYLLRDSRTHGEWFMCHPLEAKAAVEHALLVGYPRLSLYERARIRGTLMEHGLSRKQAFRGAMNPSKAA